MIDALWGPVLGYIHLTVRAANKNRKNMIFFYVNLQRDIVTFIQIHKTIEILALELTHITQPKFKYYMRRWNV